MVWEEVPVLVELREEQAEGVPVAQELSDAPAEAVPVSWGLSVTESVGDRVPEALLQALLLAVVDMHTVGTLVREPEAVPELAAGVGLVELHNVALALARPEAEVVTERLELWLADVLAATEALPLELTELEWQAVSVKSGEAVALGECEAELEAAMLGLALELAEAEVFGKVLGLGVGVLLSDQAPRVLLPVTLNR